MTRIRICSWGKRLPQLWLSQLGEEDVISLKDAVASFSGVALRFADGDRVLLAGTLEGYSELIERMGPKGLALELEEAVRNYTSRPIFKVKDEEVKMPAVMGIINLTPDSFSGDGLSGEGVESAVQRALAMVEEGAAILDVGGESTRPGHRPVTLEEETKRVIPVLKALEGIDVPISIDTTKPEMVQRAIGLIDIVNDQWGLQKRGRDNGEFARILADSEKSIILMHNWGAGSVYDGPDIVDEVISFLKGSIEIGEENGIDPERMMVDPGLGFGKSQKQSLEMVARIGELRVLGKPILVGASKEVIYRNGGWGEVGGHASRDGLCPLKRR